MTDEDAGAAVAPPSSALLDLLRRGEIDTHGVIPWSSNYALLVTVRGADAETLAIYKPRRGENPLWDFPTGTLYRREVAAFVLAEALGWELVPPTVLRKGPFGPGMVQVFIESDPEQHYFNIYPRHADAFRRIAAFDVVANNADRKAGHCLLDANDHMWSIDHGICFHVEPKLRTVLWDFAGEPLPPDLCDNLRRLQARLQDDHGLATSFRALLSNGEVQAMRHRLDALLASGRFPEPDPHRQNHPWPPI